ncbi:restriction endonuclease [Mesorhizobium sp.]|uniref:restriction endonuclease n=1 Tax=Mesorhizobium sp. TaxID=1871066 RepID=UPI0025F7FED0|nr:restriction endonuclease [Mesorhizobium sp.]
MTSILADTDLVIGVMTRERRSDWVLFDLGQAWGMGKRILLFAPPNASFLPSYLQRFLTVRANLSNREAIAFALDQLLAAPASSFAQERVPTAARILGPAADRYLQGSYQLGTSSPLELERLVENALREGGVDVVSTAPGREQGVDLAIWSDALQASVGNPLLVEIRSRLREPSLASEAVRQLSQQVAASGSYWGLLLYGDGEQTTLRGSLPPNVLLLSLKTLFERMRHEPFDDIIRDLRNRRVHGGSI